MQDVNSGIKIGIQICCLAAVMFIIVTTVILAKNFGGAYLDKEFTRTTPDYTDTLYALSYESKPIPVPAIYAALSNYGMTNLAEFSMVVGGNSYDDPERLADFFGKQLYVKLVDASDGLHMWVGDYR